jgi:predicted dehydrogenase
MARRKWRVVVFGLGMGATHVRTIANRRGFELVAVVDIREQRARDLLAEINSERASRGVVQRLEAQWFPSHQALLDSGLAHDLWVIALPNALHHEMVMTGLRAGKHVAVEKPGAENPEQLLDEVNLAARLGLVLFFLYNRRFHLPSVTEAILAGSIGDVHTARMAWYRSPKDPETVDAFVRRGPLGLGNDLISHLANIMIGSLGGPELRTVTANGFWPYPDDDKKGETDLSVTFTCAPRTAGAPVTTLRLDASWEANGPDEDIMFCHWLGRSASVRGSIWLPNGVPTYATRAQARRLYRPQMTRIWAGEDDENVKETTELGYALSVPETHVAQFDELEAALGGRPPTMSVLQVANLIDGLHGIQVSARAGGKLVHLVPSA